MLQQTQIATALPYYERWMARFPDVYALAEAAEQQALSFWQGLGYYRRCRMLQEGARYVVEHGFPSGKAEWLAIPGVGAYTASAISSICYGETCAVVDGNVERVFARLTCDPNNGSQLKSRAWEWAERHLYRAEPGEWNQAVMELGATVCRPAQPLCHQCPISRECVAYQTNRTGEFPVPKTKPKTVRYEEEIFIAVWGEKIGVQAEHHLAWWKGMSLLPLSSTFPNLGDASWKESLGEIRYTVTNHQITALVSFFRVEEFVDGLTWLSREELNETPLPAPHRKALNLYYKI
ncbi:MAG: A/G-specific adenine glycosylase [Armatimonadetes bacterium]|nr:A/G-specific adenine glycosylase [Armatimonadota bacterium]